MYIILLLHWLYPPTSGHWYQNINEFSSLHHHSLVYVLENSWTPLSIYIWGALYKQDSWPVTTWHELPLVCTRELCSKVARIYIPDLKELYLMYIVLCCLDYKLSYILLTIIHVCCVILEVIENHSCSVIPWIQKLLQSLVSLSYLLLVSSAFYLSSKCYYVWISSYSRSQYPL